MPTSAEQAAKLLRNAAKFFHQVGDQTPALSDQMEQSARNFEHVAAHVESDANGECPPLDEEASGS